MTDTSTLDRPPRTHGGRTKTRRKPHQVVTPTGVERHFAEDEIIVSKTDTTGRITYCNDVFMDISGFTEAELLGAPHSILRHPDMPRCVFKLMWDTIADKREIFAYVVNLTKNGDHYWVFAHVTPNLDADGAITGYHSNRRVPSPDALIPVRDLYAELCAIERQSPDRKAGLEASGHRLTDILASKDMTYDRFVLSL